jgi:Tat protein translocase TatB subunit
MMFGIGFSELVVIVLVLIVFVRPDDLPAIVRKLARIYAELRRAYREALAVKDEFMREIDRVSLEERKDPEGQEATEAAETGVRPAVPALDPPAAKEGRAASEDPAQGKD